MKFCIQCGNKLLPDARFCAECGTALSLTPPAPHAMAEPVAAPASAAPVWKPPVADPIAPAATARPMAAPEPPMASMFDSMPGDPAWGAGPAAAPSFAEAGWGAKPEPSLAGHGTGGYAPYSAASPFPKDVGDGAIWNPSAVAAWAFVFTPIFGGWLTAKNWRALGDPERAKKSMYWVYGFPVFLIATIIISFALESFVSESVSKIADRLIGLSYWVVWVVYDNNEQKKFVKERFSSDYPKKPWIIPLSIAFGVFVLIVALIIAAIR